MLRFSALTLVALLLSTGAHAAMVGGWEVSDKPDDKNLCSIQRNYEDKNDDNAKNSVNIVFVKDEKGAPAIVVALGYAKWDLTKDEKSKADVLFDDKAWQRGVEWEATGEKVMLTVVEKPDAFIQRFSDGKEMELHFDGKASDEASFEIPNAGQAVGAVQSCRTQQK